MKVVGTGAPRMLTVRLRQCEVAVFRDELREHRALVVDATAAGTPDDSEADRRHDELFLITGLLDQLRTASSENGVRELVGPTWLLAPIIRGAACKAAARFVSAIQEFSDDCGTPTPDELRAAVETASASTATLIGLDRAENHAVV